jgi:lactoylglutathione lyase
MATRKKKAASPGRKSSRKAPTKKRTVAKRATAKPAARKPAARAQAAVKPAAKVKAKAPALERRKMPESLRLRSLSVGLTVGDLQRSLAWYRDILGFVVTDEWRVEGALRGVEIRAGSVDIFLGQDDWKRGRDRVKGEGFRIYGRTVQDIDRLAALFKSRGGVLSHEPQTQPWGERDFGMVDPDGFRITFSSGA